MNAHPQRVANEECALDQGKRTVQEYISRSLWRGQFEIIFPVRFQARYNSVREERLFLKQA